MSTGGRPSILVFQESGFCMSEHRLECFRAVNSEAVFLLQLFLIAKVKITALISTGGLHSGLALGPCLDDSVQGRLFAAGEVYGVPIVTRFSDKSFLTAATATTAG